MKVNFKLIINKDLDNQTKIQKFANEPEVFMLHKNRNFLRRLENQGLDEERSKERLRKYEEIKEEAKALLEGKYKEPSIETDSDYRPIVPLMNIKD